MEWISNPDIWLALVTLTALEIVLGIDNIVFISILAGKLPEDQQDKARNTGLLLAMGMRILMLLAISWIIGLTDPWFSIFGNELSGRDLILIVGGLFLLGKATFEIHEKLEGEDPHNKEVAAVATFGSVIVQILLLDLVFSLDSVITAVGMADEIWVMITAVVISIGVMLLSAGAISDFVNRHPTVKMLALSFLILIGFSLIAEGWELHIPKGYIYFAMGFSIMVEALNLRVRSKKVSADPVELRPTYVKEFEATGAVGHYHRAPRP
ncbi:MAG TPA: TerC family protein [Acidimicrobiia bacterium]|nr:TerC family protein [Acidimicrobiia bacterium]